MSKAALSYRAGAWWGGLPTGARIGIAGAAGLLVWAAFGIDNDDKAAMPPTAAPSRAAAVPTETPQQARARILQQQCTTGLESVMETAKDQIAAGNLMAANATLSMCDDFPQSKEFKAFVSKSRSAIATQQKKQAAVAAAQRKSEGVRIGMSQSDVLASSWGKPQKVNTTTSARGIREQWVYGGHNYLYFENGVLTTIQN